MQQQQQPPQTQAAKFSPTLITTEQIQKCLEENKRLIMAIMEHQKHGNFQECAQYQVVLQKNLMYLAAIADAQPPTPQIPQIPQPCQVMQMQLNAIPQQGNNFMQQPQLVIPQQLSGGESSVQKLPLQQQQMLHFQQLQQLQAQMGARPSGQSGMFGMHQAMQSALVANPGGKQDGSAAGFGSDGRSVFR